MVAVMAACTETRHLVLSIPHPSPYRLRWAGDGMAGRCMRLTCGTTGYRVLCCLDTDPLSVSCLPPPAAMHLQCASGGCSSVPYVTAAIMGATGQTGIVGFNTAGIQGCASGSWCPGGAVAACPTPGHVLLAVGVTRFPSGDLGRAAQHIMAGCGPPVQTCPPPPRPPRCVALRSAPNLDSFLPSGGKLQVVQLLTPDFLD